MTIEQASAARRALWTHFLNVPHREIGPVIDEFGKALNSDPDFVGKAMYAMTFPKFNRIRDLTVAGVAVLLTAPAEFQVLRKTGAICLRRLPPHQVIQVLDAIDAINKSNRHTRKAAERFVESMDANPARLEGALLRPGNRAGLRRIAIRYHMKASDVSLPNIKRAVFDKKPLETGGRLDLVKKLAAVEDPIEQAKMAMGQKLSYQVLSSVLIPHPATIAVMVEAMSPADAVGARGWLERDGWLDTPEIMELWAKKIEGGAVSSATIENRKSAQAQTGNVAVAAAMDKAHEVAAKKDSIDRDILLIVDKSGSMQAAIQAAIMFGERVASRVTGKIMVVAVDSSARLVEPKDGKWKEAFALIRAGGETSLGVGLKFAKDKGFLPRTVVVITDEGENSTPYYYVVDGFEDAEHIFLTLGHSTQVSSIVAQRGWRVERFSITNDYAALDQVSVLLQRPLGKSIVDEILELQFPV